MPPVSDDGLAIEIERRPVDRLAVDVAAGIGTAMLFGSPPGWAALLTVGLLAAGGILAVGCKNEKANTIQVPLLTSQLATGKLHIVAPRQPLVHLSLLKST